MKKKFGIYAVIWAVALVVFNVVSFTVALNTGKEMNASFFIGYGAVTAAFIGQLLCAYFAFRADSLKKFFYNVSLISLSYGGLVAMLVLGSLTMLIPDTVSFVGIIACTVVLGAYIITVAKAKLAIEAVEQTDAKIKTQTQFIRLLTADAESLKGYAADDNARRACEKVYEAVRYSDPVSNPVLSGIESEISVKFSAFSDSVKNKADNSRQLAEELCRLISERNAKVKALK